MLPSAGGEADYVGKFPSRLDLQVKSGRSLAQQNTV